MSVPATGDSVTPRHTARLPALGTRTARGAGAQLPRLVGGLRWLGLVTERFEAWLSPFPSLQSGKDAAFPGSPFPTVLLAETEARKTKIQVTRITNTLTSCSRRRMSPRFMPGSQTACLDVFKHVAFAAPEGPLHLEIEMGSVSPCHSPPSVPGPGDIKMNKSNEPNKYIFSVKFVNVCIVV